MGVVALVVGEATTSRLMGEATRARVGDLLRSGDQVRTDREARVLVSGYGGVVGALGSEAELLVGTLGSGVAMQLLRGHIALSVEPRGAREPVVVAAGEYRVQVVGTVFEVARGDQGIVVRVVKGRVLVSGPGISTVVDAGETYRSPSTRGGGDNRLLAMLGVELTAFEPRPEPVALPIVRPRIQPLSPAPTRVPSAPELASDEEERLYREALAANDPSRAIVLLDKVVDLHGFWEEVATYRAAWQSTRVLGAQDQAARRLSAYLENYPRGAFAEAPTHGRRVRGCEERGRPLPDREPP